MISWQSQSPLRRGTLSAAAVDEIAAEMAEESQSPLRRGTLSAASILRQWMVIRLCLNPLFVGEPFPPPGKGGSMSHEFESLNPLFVGEPFPPEKRAVRVSYSSPVSIPSSSGNPFRRIVDGGSYRAMVRVSIPSSSGNPFRPTKTLMRERMVTESQSPLRRGTLSAVYTEDWGWELVYCLNPLFVGEPFPPVELRPADPWSGASLNPLFVGEPFPPKHVADSWRDLERSQSPLRRGTLSANRSLPAETSEQVVSIPSSSGNPFRPQKIIRNPANFTASQSPLRRGTLSAHQLPPKGRVRPPCLNPLFVGEPFPPSRYRGQEAP